MPTFTTADCDHMARALRLAERGRFTAHPNPVVGCVLVNGDAVVGEGYHQRTGEGHAEVNALAAAGDAARGATAYVTLEPCSHHGRTPPCAEALVNAGVSRVVVAMEDPSKKVSGKGNALLRAAGIAVETGLMASAALQLNRGFVKRVTDGRPFVRLKLACSIDGAIAMADGESQWITGAAARADVQRQRARAGAIMTGIGTVLADDPSLTVRAAGLTDRQPLRVVLDSQLRMPDTAKMLELPGSTLVCSTSGAKASESLAAKAELTTCGSADGVVDAVAVLTELAAREINEVLVEAGATLAGNLLKNGLVDELLIYQAPHLLGNQTMPLIATPSWRSLSDRALLTITDRRQIGDDTRITAELQQSTG